MVCNHLLLATISLISVVATNAIVVESSRESARRRATTATKEDFTIKCTFGIFSDELAKVLYCLYHDIERESLIERGESIRVI